MHTDCLEWKAEQA